MKKKNKKNGEEGEEEEDSRGMTFARVFRWIKKQTKNDKKKSSIKISLVVFLFCFA